jgi:hypothetical protein
MYISIDNALKFAKDYHKEQLTEWIKNSNCRCNEPMVMTEQPIKQNEDSFSSEKPFGNVEPLKQDEDYFKDCY